MEGLGWPTSANWALAVCMALTIVGAMLLRKWERRRKAEDALDARVEELKAAQKAYSDAIRNGTPAEAAAAKRSVDSAARRVQEISRTLGCLVIVAALCACFHKPFEPTETIVRLDEHVRIVEPGSIVPPYPEGQGRWWLLTPFGLEELLPDDGVK